MLELSDCIPGMPVKSIYGIIGIIASRPFPYERRNSYGGVIEITDTISIILRDGSMLSHANLEAFSVYRGKHDTNR